MGNAVKRSSGDRGKGLEEAAKQLGICSVGLEEPSVIQRGKLTRSELRFGRTDIVSVGEGTSQSRTAGLDIRVKVWDQR